LAQFHAFQPIGCANNSAQSERIRLLFTQSLRKWCTLYQELPGQRSMRVPICLHWRILSVSEPLQYWRPKMSERGHLLGSDVSHSGADFQVYLSDRLPSILLRNRCFQQSLYQQPLSKWWNLFPTVPVQLHLYLSPGLERCSLYRG